MQDRLFVGALIVFGLGVGGCGTSEADPCAGLRCPAGQVCDPELSACVDADPCAGVDCAAGTECDPADGTCRPVTECAGDADCDPTERCGSAGLCVSRCDGVSCTGGATCDPLTGLCTGGEADCTSDEDCRTDLGEVCDSQAGICLGGAGVDCTADPSRCAAGFRCVAGFQGGASLCLATCTDSTTCAVHERCVPPEEDPDLGGTCYLNLCGPEGAAGVQTAEYQAACDAAGSGDGICLGPMEDGSGGSLGVGVCYGVGTAAPGEACADDARHGDAQACGAGGWCGVRPGEHSGLCYALCALFDGTSCAPFADGTSTVCYALWDLAGVCLEQQDPPVAEGEACEETESSALACVEDALCVTDSEGGDTVCRAACDPAATEGAGTCAVGTCTPLSGQPELGVCQ